MGMKLSRGPHLDMGGLKREAQDVQAEYGKLRELAIKFMTDKDSLEETIKEIKDSNISYEDKKEILKSLEYQLNELIKEFDTEVADKEDELNDQHQEIIDTAAEEEREVEKQIDNMSSIVFQRSETSVDSAVNSAESKKRELNEFEQEEYEKLRLQMQQAEDQRRYMQRRNISR